MISFQSISARLESFYKKQLYKYRLRKQGYYKYCKCITKLSQSNGQSLNKENSTFNVLPKYKDDFQFDICKLLSSELLINNNEYQNAVFYFLVRQLNDLVDNPEIISFLNNVTKDEGFTRLYNNFSQALKPVDDDYILNLKIPNCNHLLKLGMLGLKYGALLPENYLNTASIEYVDFTQKNIKIVMYGLDDFDVKAYLDEVEIPISYKKITRRDLFNRTFIKFCTVWVPYRENILNENTQNITKKNLRIKLNSKVISLKLKELCSPSFTIGNILDSFDNILQIRNQEDPKLWLISDRLNKADDNGEHFARYMQHEHPEINVFYVLSHKCKDWKRLKNEGIKLLKQGSLKHKKQIKKASVLICSHTSRLIIANQKKSKFSNKRIVWLQHGIILSDLSRFINSQNLGKLELLLTSTPGEYESMVHNNNRLSYGEREIKLLGLARYDRLHELSLTNPQKNQIVVFFTWRGNINQQLTDSEFFATDYAKRITSFLNSQTLKNLVNEYQYKIIFAPHPMLKHFGHCIHLPSKVRLFDASVESLQSVFATSKLMITDYSSVAFDFAFLNRPVIYYQYDFDTVYNKATHTGQKGYFNFERAGFGPVVYDESSLIKQIEQYLKNDCRNPDMYQERCKNTFSLEPGHNCERTYEAILDLVTQK